jgi:hypothetical protein
MLSPEKTEKKRTRKNETRPHRVADHTLAENVTKKTSYANEGEQRTHEKKSSGFISTFFYFVANPKLPVSSKENVFLLTDSLFFSCLFA